MVEKTTLTAAILAVKAEHGLAERKDYSEIAKGGTVRDETKTVTIITRHVEYETERRHDAHIDCPGHPDCIKNMISGAAQMDGAILLTSAVDRPMPQTREHILLARQVTNDVPLSVAGEAISTLKYSLQTDSFQITLSLIKCGQPLATGTSSAYAAVVV